MKEIIGYLKTFIREDFNYKTYLFTAIFLTIAIYFNYTYGFERKLVIRHYGTFQGYIFSFLFYSLAYYSIAIPKFLIEKKKQYLLKSEFWIKSLVFISLIGAVGAFNSYKSIIDLFDLNGGFYYWMKILANSKRMVFYIIPLLIIKYVYDRQSKGLYGLQSKGFHWKPYFTMLLIMLPLITWASFQDDFLRTYPTIKLWKMNEVWGISKSQMAIIYELIYGWDFIFVELIFRGALVIGLATIIGKDAILPMVSVYAFLHFGKPLGETLGSIFGGYILGVIALYTKNILGGCVIHIGVAYLMEAAAFVQYLFIKN
ncbi:MAG TPA: hypothetical protein DDX39_01565 [Bacteroidales bacterium]|nr:MAG: hypothetical protein A2W98_07780 [Bacteroidetes bacterium GWF2_33_38]HBF87299.1 hypothetical protein [Bacteroidales bacterium]